MTTKPSNVGLDRGIYSGPFDAFTNYMNILGDFINRVNALYPLDIDNDELEGLLTTIKNQGDEIEMKDKEIERLHSKLEKLEAAKPKAVKAEAKPKAAKAEAKPKAAKAKPASK
jgi:alpha-amylase